jgi:hypothetical protein
MFFQEPVYIDGNIILRLIDWEASVIRIYWRTQFVIMKNSSLIFCLSIFIQTNSDATDKHQLMRKYSVPEIKVHENPRKFNFTNTDSQRKTCIIYDRATQLVTDEPHPTCNILPTALQF